MSKLTRRQQVFVERYLTTWNSSDAARHAGYTGDAAVIGSRLLRNVQVAAAIAARLEELTLAADEVLARLSQQARANIADFFLFNANGEITGLDETVLKERGYLVKKLKTDADGKIELELYDAQAALVQIGRRYALFTDRTEAKQQTEVKDLDALIEALFAAELAFLAGRRESSAPAAVAGAAEPV